MTTRPDITRRVEELLGPNGSEQMAVAMAAVMERAGVITFDPTAGYEMDELDGDQWLGFLAEAEAEILSLAGAIMSARRKTKAGGPGGAGRPRVRPYCACGQFPLARVPRGHRCP